jgi:hypothetical protein
LFLSLPRSKRVLHPENIPEFVQNFTKLSNNKQLRRPVKKIFDDSSIFDALDEEAITVGIFPIVNDQKQPVG